MSRVVGDWGWLRSEGSDGGSGGRMGWAICLLAGGLRYLVGEEASVAGAVERGLSGCRATRWGYEETTLLDCQQQGLPEHQRTLVWSTRRTVTTRKW